MPWGFGAAYPNCPVQYCPFLTFSIRRLNLCWKIQICHPLTPPLFSLRLLWRSPVYLGLIRHGAWPESHLKSTAACGAGWIFGTMEVIKIKMLNGGYTAKSLCIELNAHHLLVKELNMYCTDNHGIFISGGHFKKLFCILNSCQTLLQLRTA